MLPGSIDRLFKKPRLIEKINRLIETFVAGRSAPRRQRRQQLRGRRSRASELDQLEHALEGAQGETRQLLQRKRRRVN